MKDARVAVCCLQSGQQGARLFCTVDAGAAVPHLVGHRLDTQNLTHICDRFGQLGVRTPKQLRTAWLFFQYSADAAQLLHPSTVQGDCVVGDSSFRSFWLLSKKQPDVPMRHALVEWMQASLLL